MKIFKEDKKIIRKIPPPRPIYVYPQNKKGENVNIFIKETVFNEILQHCKRMESMKKEAMGLLIGDVRKWKDSYTIIFDLVSGKLDSSPHYVRFERDAFEEISDKLDEIDYEYVIVGWYHSHIDNRSFMSAIDIETQKKFFNKPFHVALVIDVARMETKAFKLIGENCISIPYAIF